MVVLFWSLLVISLFFYHVHEIRKQTSKLVKQEALVHYNKDLASRLWAASHGGVYVPVTE